MTVWDVVTSGATNEETTCNFMKNDNSLYEVSILSSIESNGPVTSLPKVIAKICGPYFCIAIDDTVNIFADPDCSEILSNVVFESKINCFCMCQDFIVLGCSDGNIYVLHIPSGGQLVLTHFIEDNSDPEKDCFVSIVSMNNEYKEFIILCRSGRIYSVNCSCLEEIAKLFDQVNETLNETLANKYELENSTICNLHSEITSATALNHRDIILAQNKKLLVFNIKNEQKIISSCDNPVNIIKIEHVKNTILLFALTASGQLLACNSTTFDWIVIYSEISVRDFLITQDVHDSINLTLFTKESEILIISFTGSNSEIKHQFTASEYCYAISSDTHLEEPLFIEGKIKRPESQFIDTLLIKSITQGSPEYTLKKLLKREKFTEAELFAKKFNLNLDNVYKAMTVNISNKLNAKISKSESSQLVDELIRVCELIEDVNFVVECCQRVTVSYFDQIQKLLTFARHRLETITNSELIQQLSTTHASLVETSLRLETYKLITLYHEHSDDSCDIHGWIEFSKADMLKIIERYLQKQNLHVACLIWCRFQHYILAKDPINCSKILLEAVLHISKPEQIIPFFKHFLPTVLQYNPNTLSQIIEFVINKIKLLEKDYNDIWPEVGIEFSEELLSMLNINEQLTTDNSCVIVQQYANSSVILNQLFYIIHCLKDLLVLKQTHQIIIPLDKYLEENKNDVVISILDRVSPSNIDYLFENFLDKFLRNNKIDSDKLIEDYVQGITFNSSELSCYKASWETRVITLIKHIHDLTTRLECIIKILRVAPVPWSSCIEQLAHTSLDEQHVLVNDIRTEIDQVGLKLMVKKYNFRISIVNNYREVLQLVYRILHRGKLTEILNDLQHIIKSNLVDNDEINYLVLLHFIKTGNFEYFLSYLNTLNEKSVIDYCERFVYLMEQHLKFNASCSTNFYEVLSIINSKLQKTNDYMKNKIKILKNVYLLRDRFNIFIHPDEYETKSKRLEHFKLFISENSNINETQNLCYKICELSKLLQIPNEEALLLLISNCSLNSKSIMTVAKHFLTSLDSDVDKNPEIFCSLAIKLLLNNYATGFSENVDTETIYMIENSKLALNFIHVACVQRPTDPSYFEVERWILIYRELCQLSSVAVLSGDNPNRVTLVPLYRDRPVGCGVVTAYKYVQEFFSLILQMSNFFPNNIFVNSFHKHSINISECELENNFKLLVPYLKNLRTSQYDFVLFYIILMFHKFLLLVNEDLEQLSPTIRNYAQKTTKWLDTCRQILLRKIVSSRKVDFQLATVLLNEMPQSEVLKWIAYHQKSFSTDYVKLSTVCRLGMSYSVTHNLGNMIPILDKTLLQTKWANRLSQLVPIHVKDILGNDNFGDLLKQIALRENIPLQLILELGHDFKWDEEHTLLEILNVMLLEWKPDIDFSSIKTKSIHSSDKMIIKCTNYLNLETRCLQVLSYMHNKKELLIHHLEKIWDATNYYYYEIYRCILKLFTELGHDRSHSNNNNLLNFLMSYIRLERPPQYEKDRWSTKFFDTVDIPDIAQYRLPFFIFSGKQHTAEDIQIIRNELNIFTCQKWAEISVLINLKKDSIFAFAIKQTVISDIWSKTFGDLSSKQWTLQTKNTDILKRIYDIANQIKNIEIAIGTLYFVTNSIPPGADRVTAAEICYNLSLKWVRLEDSQACIDKVRKMYEKCRCLHILYTYQLETFQDKINQPELLLTALYEHPNIVNRVKSATVDGPDINAAAEEIATLFQIELKKFQIQLIEKLFQGNDECFNNDETFSLSLSKDLNTDQELEDNLLRICYILQSFDIQEAIGYLMSIAVTPEDMGGDGDNNTFTNFTLTYSNLETATKVSDRIRYKAIKCLICIADSNTIEAVSSWTIETLQQYRRTLWYLIKFEELGISYNAHRLLTCDKFRLVEGLWTTYSKCISAIPLMSSLMLEYNIGDRKLWECVISQMMQFNMIKELRQLLPRLIFQSLLLSSKIYIQAWQRVIQHFFMEVQQPLSDAVEKNCIDGLILLMTCPVVSELDISPVIEYCFQIERPQFVAVLLPFIPANKREAIVTRIFKLKKATLLDDIEQLSTWISTTEQAVNILTQFPHKL